MQYVVYINFLRQSVSKKHIRHEYADNKYKKKYDN